MNVIIRKSRFQLFAILLTILLPAAAFAQTGVSNDRVSLPEGPGSLEGVGENVEIDPNMGAMRYSVPIRVSQGYPGMTPKVTLAYSSGSGGSVVGMGWSLSVPFVERMTVYGLPKYDPADHFSVNEGEHLVRIPGTDPPIYRSRFEKGFVRYTWHDSADGKEGYWTGEHPDGRISYFGADSDGTIVDSARVSGAGGTFRYHLVVTVDRYGHEIQYTYNLYGNVTLVQHIGWVYTGATPAYEITFEYEDRLDLLSDCKAGFNELLEKRLTRVNVLARGQRIRRYDLAYEGYATSGGFSRLTDVQMHGLSGDAYPVHESFEYSRALGAQCQDVDCLRPYIIEMGSVTLDIQNGYATLLDINGDALPDIVDTYDPGAHQIYLNVLAPDGTSSFDGPFSSTYGSQGSHNLSSAWVQVLDVEGDGFTDMINAQNGEVLKNLGGGDWHETYSLLDVGSIPDLGTQLATTRFLDYDNDKRIDIIRSVGAGASNQTFIYRNDGPDGFSQDTSVDPQLGAGFDSDSLELNDMNGDGMLDAVQVMQSEVRYRLNLGWGQWEDWKIIGGFDFTDVEAKDAELEDLNGDGLADLVLAAGNQVRLWVNRNGDSFDPEQVITSDDVDGDIPARMATTTVLYADMNGNGSSDVVSIDNTYGIIVLELFPVRPNLMSKVSNGLGRVTEVTYGTSVEHQAQDGGQGAWAYKLPHPMIVVDRFDEYDELTNVHQIVDYIYHDGYYDGQEKQFRGYERVEQSEPGDESCMEGMLYEIYDVGFSDPYFNGLLLNRDTQSGGSSYQYQESEYGECEVAGVPDTGLTFEVKHICMLGQTTEYREGRPASEWITTRVEHQYDGYGNVILKSDLGVTAVAGGACQACDGSGFFGTPCGADCSGDEKYESTVYALPEDNGDLWILDRSVTKRTYGVANAQGAPASDTYTETITYYDGPDYVGLDAGLLTHGTVTRTTERVDAAGNLVETIRYRLDDHGNMVERIDANGTISGNDHRRIYTFDPEGLRIIRTEILMENADGPYRLRQDIQYDPYWDKVIESTDWMVTQGGEPVDARNSSFYTYDQFGLLASMTRPGETAGIATEQFSFQLANPSSAIQARRRSTRGGELDIESVQCFDGHGRMYQERTLLGPGSYQVTGFTIFNDKGDEREVYQAYLGDTPDCDPAPPAGTLSLKTNYDPVGRPVLRIQPHGGAGAGPETRIEYLPLVEVEYDAEDTNPSGPHADTPTTTRRNGLGWVISKERVQTPGGAELTHRFLYDELGNQAGWVDPGGNQHVQEYDFLERVVLVSSPDNGVTTFEYDDFGNLIRTEDARGVVTLQSYDGVNRVLAEWDQADEAGTKIEYTYDMAGDCPAEKCTNLAGRPASVSYPLEDGELGIDRFGYMSRGKVTYTGRLVEGHLFEFDTTYDNAGRPINNTFPNGTSFDLVYDGAGRLVSVPGYIEQLSYDERGQIDEMTLVNGVLLSRAYDDREWLTALNATGPEGTLLAYGYTRDLVGSILEITDGRADDGGPMGGARYTYDSFYRLIQAELDPERAAHAETLTLGFDNIENITSKVSSLGAESKAHVGDYQYGDDAGPHAVTQAGDVTFEYDQAGNAVLRGEHVYQWDHKGRMTGAQGPAGELARFVYGSSDERLIKREEGSTTYYLSQDFEVRDGVAQIYLRVDDQRVVEIEDPLFATRMLSDVAPARGPPDGLTAEPDGAISAGDAWIAQGVGIGALTFSAATEVSDVRALLRASAKRTLAGGEESQRFHHHDHMSNAVAVTDQDGQLVERSEYYPFGLVRHSTGEKTIYGHAGKEQDKSTGLEYYGARYFDPWSARWMSPDHTFRVVDEDTLVRVPELSGAYVYNNNNPINTIDKDGKIANWLIGGIVGAVVNVVGEIIVQAVKPPSGTKKLSVKGILKATGSVLWAGVKGFGFGALSSGLSAISDGASKVASIVGASVDRAKWVKAGKPPEGLQSYNSSDVAGSTTSLLVSFGKTCFKAGTGDIGGAVMSGIGATYHAANLISLKTTQKTLPSHAGTAAKKAGSWAKKKISAKFKKMKAKRAKKKAAKKNKTNRKKAARKKGSKKKGKGK